MDNINGSNNRNRRSIFDRVSVSLTVPMLLASSNLATGAALANDLGGRGEAWQQFRSENANLKGSALNHAFKEHWGGGNNSPVNDAVSSSILNANSNVINNINNSSSARLQLNDFGTKEEFKAYREALRQQNISNQITQSIQSTDSSRIVKVNSGFSLDLTSAVENITLGSNLFKEISSVTINVGGAEKTLQSGSKVTAAEYVAAKQALITGAQTVNLDGNGRATGGTVDLSAMTTGNASMKVDDLVVPVAVIASGDFGKGGDVRIQGDLINSGSINAYSSNGSANAVLRADNITNNSGADINSTVSDLTLQADRNFSNFGTISATGNLTVSAEKTLTNNGSILADGNLNVISTNINNAGALGSSASSVNFGGVVGKDLVINNHGGTISALNGAINLRDASYIDKNNTAVYGGDLLSKEVNIYTGGGTSDVFVNELTGVVSSTGSAAHVSANTDVLTLGSQCLVGDPTYYNTGSIIIGGDFVVGEALAIIAGGNITSAVTPFLTIRAAETTGAQNGMDITLVAGAQVSGSLPNNSNVNRAVITGPSGTGGNIDFFGATAGIISSSGAGAESKAGDVTLVAYGNGPGTGKVLLGNDFDVAANATGSDVTSTGGNINILAGSAIGTAIRVGALSNSGSATGAGVINVFNAQPEFDSGTEMVFNGVGQVTSGNKFVPSSSPSSADVFIDKSIDSDGDVTVLAGNALDINGDIRVRNGNQVIAAATGSSVRVENIDVSSNQTGVDAGTVQLLAGTFVSARAIDLSSIGGRNAGKLNVATDSAITLVANAPAYADNAITAITTSVGTGDAASIELVNNGSGGIKVESALSLPSGNGNAGSLRLIAPNGTLDITALGPTLNFNGTGNGNGGSVSLVYEDLLTSNVSPDLFQITANSAGTGGGGHIYLNDTSLDFMYFGNTSPFTVSALGAGGSITAVSGGILSVTGTNPLLAENIKLTAGEILLDSSLSGKNLTLTANTITVGSSSVQDFTGGTIRIATPSLTAANIQFIADVINVSNSGNLTINGGTGNGVTFSAAQTYLTAGNTLTTQGKLNYDGSAVLSGASIVATGSTNTLTTPTGEGVLLTSSLTGGTFDPNGRWLATNTALALANSAFFPTSGDITLTGDINFGGVNFAIVSSGNINLTGANINLSGVNGGSLTLLAGYLSSPITNGVPTYTNGTVSNISTPFSGGGGSILGSANINTSATGAGGVGGSVVAYAHHGSISLGNIQTNGSGGSGNVVIQADGDITVRNIFTDGPSGGDVVIAVSDPILANASISNGVLNGLSGSTIKSAGDINAGAISVGNLRNVTIVGALNADDVINITSTTGAGSNTLRLESGLGATDLGTTNFGFLNGSGGGSGSVKVIGSAPQFLIQSLGNPGLNWDLDVLASGNLDIRVVQLQRLNANAGFISFGDPFAGTPAMVAGDATLTSTSSVLGRLDVGGKLLITATSGIGGGPGFGTNATDIEFHSGTVNFNLTNTGTVNIQGDTSLVGGSSVTLRAAGSVNTTGSGIGSIGVNLIGLPGASFGTEATPFRINNSYSNANLSITAESGAVFDSFVVSDVSSNTEIRRSEGGNLTLRASDANSQVTIGNISPYKDDLSITANNVLLSPGSIQFDGALDVQSDAGHDLSFDGGAGSTISAVDGIRIKAGSGDLVLKGLTTYSSAAELSGASVILAAGSNSTALQPSFIYTSNLDVSPGGVLTTFTPPSGGAPGDTWTVYYSGTYANDGDLTITGSLTNFNLALIASGNITVNGDIDLFGGGSLTMLSGYNFTPGGTGIFYPTQSFTNFTPTGAGSILVTGNITTSVASGDGGSITAAANNGSITLANIDTSAANGTAGSVTLIASNGVTVNNIDTTGSTSGSVNIATAAPILSAGYAIDGGIATGTLTAGAMTDASININRAASGTNEIKLTTGQGGSVTVGDTLTAASIDVYTGDLVFVSTNEIAALPFANTYGGAINLDVNTATTLLGGSLKLTTLSPSGFGQITLNVRSTDAVTLGDSGQYKFETESGLNASAYIGTTFAGDVTVSNGAFVGRGAGAVFTSVNTNGNITVNSGAYNLRDSAGAGSSVILHAGLDGTGILTLNDASFFQEVNGTGVDSRGGILSLLAEKIVTPGLGNTITNPLNLTAKGTGNGNGGIVRFNQTASTTIVVGQSKKLPKGDVLFITADASAEDSGNGEGGLIDIKTGGDLLVNDTSLLDASKGALSGHGASYSLVAGSTTHPGNLLVNGTLDASGNIDAGTISLESYSTTAFSVGGKNAKNGILGNLVAVGPSGSIVLVNHSGGVTINSSSALQTSTLEIEAGGRGSIRAGKGIVLTTGSLTLTTDGGSAGTSNNLLGVNAQTIAVNTGGNGSSGINNLYTGLTVLSDSRTGASFTLKTAGSLLANSIATTAGNILLVSNSGNLTVASGERITANNGSLTLQNTDTTGQIVIQDNATVETQQNGKNTILVVGATIPKKGLNPVLTDSTVGGININVEGEGIVYLGGPPNAVVTAGSANVNAINKSVIFSGPAGSIVLGNGSTVIADPPSVAVASAVSQNSISTADLSVRNLNASPGLQTVSDTNLVTSTNENSVSKNTINVELSRLSAISKIASLADDDNSFIVGNMGRGGAVEAAVCSNIDLGYSSIPGMSNVKTIVHSECVTVTEGTVVFAPSKDTQVETPNGNVRIAANSVVLLSTSNLGLAVYDLDDQHKGSVSVESSGQNIVLSPGRHVLITKHHGAEFAQINAVETIAHRNVQSSIKNGHRVHHSEFSVISALDTVKPLRALASSKNVVARQIAQRMIKTTAIMLQLGGNGGQYQHYFKPSLTAMK